MEENIDIAQEEVTEDMPNPTVASKKNRKQRRAMEVAPKVPGATTNKSKKMPKAKRKMAKASKRKNRK